MLNKEICKKCRINYCLPHWHNKEDGIKSIYFHFNKEWKNKKVACHMAHQMVSACISTYGEIPEKCSYLLEQLMGKENVK